MHKLFQFIIRARLTPKNGAVSNLYSTNCSGTPSVVWNPHFILGISPKQFTFILTYLLQHNFVITRLVTTFLSYIHLLGKLKKFSSFPRPLKLSVFFTQKFHDGTLVHFCNSFIGVLSRYVPHYEGHYNNDQKKMYNPKWYVLLCSWSNRTKWLRLSTWRPQTTALKESRILDPNMTGIPPIKLEDVGLRAVRLLPVGDTVERPDMGDVLCGQRVSVSTVRKRIARRDVK